MSEVIETLQQSGDEAALLVRTFDANLSADGDGRTIEGLVVPYNIPSRVTDPGVGVAYDESFTPGAFRGATNAPNRVLLDFEHYGAQFDAVGSMGSLQGTLGWCTSLEERPEGLWGRFRVGKNADGDKALELVNAGVLRAFSVAFKPLRSLRTAAGAMQRVKAHLDRVSLCREGAYPQAQVLAVRAAVTRPDTVDLPARFDSELSEGLSRWIKVPEALGTLKGASPALRVAPAETAPPAAPPGEAPAVAADAPLDDQVAAALGTLARVTALAARVQAAEQQVEEHKLDATAQKRDTLAAIEAMTEQVAAGGKISEAMLAATARLSERKPRTVTVVRDDSGRAVAYQEGTE